MRAEAATDCETRCMSVLVTGGAGFIGSHFIERLLAGRRRGQRRLPRRLQRLLRSGAEARQCRRGSPPTRA